MKTYVLLLLWLVAGIASNAQPIRPAPRAASRDCRECCESPDEPGLLRVLAPELSAQCPECTLIAVAQCTLTEADIAAQSSRLRYTLRNPDGTISTHITSMTMTPTGWHLVLYPPGDPVPACGQPLP
jgi:hypothetical protein